jgi:hypothetical protein
MDQTDEFEREGQSRDYQFLHAICSYPNSMQRWSIPLIPPLRSPGHRPVSD